MYASRSGELLVWDTSSWASTSTVTLGGKYQLLNFELEGKLLIGLANETNTLIIWDPISGTKIGTICGGDKSLSDYVISPDGKMLATIQSDDTTLWSLPSCNQLQLLPHSRPANDVRLAFSPTGRQLAISNNAEITLWDAYGDWLSDEEARMDLELAALHQAYTKKPYAQTLTWLQHRDRYERQEQSYGHGANNEEDEDDLAIRAFSELVYEREPQAIIKSLCRYSYLSVAAMVGSRYGWMGESAMKSAAERVCPQWYGDYGRDILVYKHAFRGSTLKKAIAVFKKYGIHQSNFTIIPAKLEEPRTDEMKETLNLRSQRIHALSAWILHSTMTAALAKRLLHHKQLEDAKARWETDRLISQHHAAEKAAWVAM
jgi:hypothetical protein